MYVQSLHFACKNTHTHMPGVGVCTCVCVQICTGKLQRYIANDSNGCVLVIEFQVIITFSLCLSILSNFYTMITLLLGKP